GAASLGPGLETALAQILGGALGLPADRFDVRHPDTAAVESGVGTYGSRATVTAGNAAHMAGDKLISEARRRAAAALGVAEDAISYETGRLSADGRSLTLGELARQQSLAVDASFKVSKVTYAGCGVAVIAAVEAATGLAKRRPDHPHSAFAACACAEIPVWAAPTPTPSGRHCAISAPRSAIFASLRRACAPSSRPPRQVPPPSRPVDGHLSMVPTCACIFPS